jgi:hypothetical protein
MYTHNGWLCKSRIQRSIYWKKKKTEDEAVIVCLKETHIMIKDTTRTLLITRISQCQQNEVCLFNDVTDFSLTLFFYVWHVEDLYIHTNNVTTIAYRLIKNMWCVHVDTHAHANSILSRRDDDVRIINFRFYTYIQCTDAPTGRI